MDGTDARTETAQRTPLRRGAEAQTCRTAVFDILFEGRAPSEGRLEALLDRLERAR